MRLKHILGACLLSLTLMGCFTTGKDFPSEMDWIRKDITTQNDVKMILGEPFSVGSSGGVPTWTYAFYKYQVGGKTTFKELKFYWGSNKVVKSYTFNSSFPGDVATGKKHDPKAVLQ